MKQDPNDEPASVLLERIRAEKEQLIQQGKIKKTKATATTDTPHYQNTPFDIPKNWKWVRLGEVAINRDSERIPLSTEVRKKQNNKQHDYYGASGVIDKVSNYLFNERLLLVGEDGANLLSRSKDNAFFAEGKYWVNNHAHVIDCIDKTILDYIAIVINATPLDKYITGSAQPKFTQDNLNNFPIPLPPIAEQRRIVAEVERLFALIDDLEANKQDLQSAIKQVRAKVLDLAIHGKLVPQDPNDEPATALLRRINPHFVPSDTSHYQNIPQEWEVCRLEDIVDVLDNKRKPIKAEERAKRIDGKKNLYPYYGATGFVGYIDEYLIDGEFILLGEDGAPFLDRYATKAYAVNGKIWVNNHAHILLPKIDFEYMLHYLNAIDYAPYAKGTTRLKLTQGDMSKILVLLPPIEEQKRISNQLAKIFNVLHTISAEL